MRPFAIKLRRWSSNFHFLTYTAENEAEPSYFPVAQDGTVPQVHISSAIGCRLFSSKAKAEQKELGNVMTLRLSYLFQTLQKKKKHVDYIPVRFLP